MECNESGKYDQGQCSDAPQFACGELGERRCHGRHGFIRRWRYKHGCHRSGSSNGCELVMSEASSGAQSAHGQEAWRPDLDARDQLLSGKSAWSLYRLLEGGVWVGGALLLLLIVGVILQWDGPVPDLFFAAIMLILLLDAVAYVPVVYVRLLARKKNEVRAGYTTVTNEFPQVGQVDPQTGRIVRVAGEDCLMRQEYLRRIVLIRESIREGSARP